MRIRQNVASCLKMLKARIWRWERQSQGRSKLIPIPDNDNCALLLHRPHPPQPVLTYLLFEILHEPPWKNIVHKLMIAAFFQSTSESFWKSSPAQKPFRALVKLLHTSEIILFLLNFFRRISSDVWLWRWQKFFNIFSAWCVSLFHHRSKLENIIKGGTFVNSKVAPCFLMSFPTGGFLWRFTCGDVKFLLPSDSLETGCQTNMISLVSTSWR